MKTSKTKYTKKGVGIITSLALIVSITVSGFTATAAELENSPEEYTLLSTVTIDEYSMIKDLKSESNDQLLESGYELDQIESLRALDFEEELKNRSTLSDSELEGLGYSEDAIQNLKSMDENPTEAQLVAASSNLTFNVWAGSQHGHNSSLSWAVYYMTWGWDSQPVWNEQDMVAIAWSEGMYLTPSSQSTYTYAYVNYYDDSDGSFWNTEYYSTAITPDLNKGASVTYNQGKSVGGWPTTVWAKSGAFGIKLTKQANVPEMCVQAAYGHSQLAATPSVTFEVSGSGASASCGISFSWFVNSLASDYLYLSL